VVPKFHLPGHGIGCHLDYNLAYTKWAGRMDGERIEAGWAQTAPMATWTRESGPNARRGILDDHWNASNWRKVLRLRKPSNFPSPLHILILNSGTSLDRNLRRSFAWSKTQREVATLISKSYPAAVVNEWRKIRDDFDRDPLKANPYEEVEQRTIFSIVAYSSLLPGS
jgi:hypothetical protein